jgi:hypothetical protein
MLKYRITNSSQMDFMYCQSPQFIYNQFEQVHVEASKVVCTYAQFIKYRHWELLMPIDM